MYFPEDSGWRWLRDQEYMIDAWCMISCEVATWFSHPKWTWNLENGGFWWFLQDDVPGWFFGSSRSFSKPAHLPPKRTMTYYPRRCVLWRCFLWCQPPRCSWFLFPSNFKCPGFFTWKSLASPETNIWHMALGNEWLGRFLEGLFSVGQTVNLLVATRFSTSPGRPCWSLPGTRSWSLVPFDPPFWIDGNQMPRRCVKWHSNSMPKMQRGGKERGGNRWQYEFMNIFIYIYMNESYTIMIKEPLVRNGWKMCAE